MSRKSPDQDVERPTPFDLRAPAAVGVTDALLFWLLAGSSVGLAGLPFAAFSSRGLPGRGLALARPLGLLLVGYPLWLLASLDVVPVRRPSERDRGRRSARRPWRGRGGVPAAAPRSRGADRPALLAGELLFARRVLRLDAAMHSFSPDVWQTEKPMDMAIVNAINRSESSRPTTRGSPARTSTTTTSATTSSRCSSGVLGLDPAVGFNLAVPLFFALSATSVFAVASALFLALRARVRARTASRRC